jgi:8-amino-7-oxononanoate synthase
MDGDLCPINSLVNITKTNNNFLYLDEAHATGVFGSNGMGLLSSPNNNTVVLGTFGKGCGSFGAYIACSTLLKEYLINFCAGLIYTTALPPSVLASIQAALELIPSMVDERQRLLNRSQLVKEELDSIGFETGKSASQIICLYLNENELATSLAQYLEENNIYARAIKPPTVPVDSARIRLSLSISHSDTDIEQLLSILKRWYANK